MGLLNKIRNEHTSPAIPKAPAEISNRVDDGVHARPVEPAVKCATCGSPTFWRSAYGGPLRCAVCEPWPSMAMVGERWTLWTRRDATLAWIQAKRPGERTGVPADVLGDQAADADRDEGVRWENVDDDDGSWLVIWKINKQARQSRRGV